MSTELCDAIQALLAASNQAKRTGVYAKDPSLLAGATVWKTLGHRDPVQVRACVLATVRRVIVEDTGVQMMLS